jgi:uncharacterized protein (UPF0548 family)
MFFLRRPSDAVIQQFLEDSRSMPLSYGPVGLLNDPGRRRLDEARVTIGRGTADFARARAALESWQQFDIGWVELFPPKAPTATGTVVAVLIRHLGFWSLNGCRVVYQVEGEGRFGYAYGTLPNHAEAGEELFEVSLDPGTGEVTYRIRATSWAFAPLTYPGQPFARVLQARFRRDSARVMARAIG